MIPYRMNPLGIREVIPMTLTAEQSMSTVRLTAIGSPVVSGLHYRLGKSGLWLPYTIGDTITLNNIGDSVQFWNSSSELGTSNQNYVLFSLSGSVSGHGNFLSLINYGDTLPSHCFYQMFYRGYSLVWLDTDVFAAAKTVGVQCLRNAFLDCTALTNAAVPSATVLAAHCYYQMFRGCSNLASIEVPFTTWSGDTTNWLYGVAASGTFIKPAALPEEYDASKIPTGWTVVNK